MTSTKKITAEDCSSLVERAIAEHKYGRAAAAEQLYSDALRAHPSHPEANHNLAILLLQSGDRKSALQHFRTALENDADRELYWLSYTRALLLAGRPNDALAVLREGAIHGFASELIDALAHQARAMAGTANSAAPADQRLFITPAQARAMADRGEVKGAVAWLRNALAQRPSNADELLLQLGDLLAESGDTDAAITALKEVIGRTPNLAEAHHHLGSILSENGHIAEGFEHLMQRAKLVHFSGTPLGKPELAHKSKHDAEQRAYLIQTGVLAPDELLRFHIADGERLAGPAVNPANGSADLQTRWQQASPRFLVVDDFLVPQALEQLRRFCAASTVWKRVYEAGYLGATPEDGFACPLLAQIVEETQTLYAPILRQHPFRYLGAFKYDSELSSGTNTHADFSAVNVNLYIAPDEANLASDCGGMVIWDVAAQSEGELRYYNGHEYELRALLEKRCSTPHHIPHRANRAVIFASALFHKTDDCTFKEGYLNKRINVSLLFGDWQTC